MIRLLLPILVDQMNSKQFNDDILRLTKSEIGYEMILNQPDHGEIDIKGVIVYA